MEMYFRASRRVSFSYFPETALDHEGCPPIPFRMVVDDVRVFSSSPIQYLKWSSL